MHECCAKQCATPGQNKPTYKNTLVKLWEDWLLQKLEMSFLKNKFSNRNTCFTLF